MLGKTLPRQENSAHAFFTRWVLASGYFGLNFMIAHLIEMMASTVCRWVTMQGLWPACHQQVRLSMRDMASADETKGRRRMAELVTGSDALGLLVRPALRIYAPTITRDMRNFRMRFRDEAEFAAALEAYLATIGADLNAVLRRPIRRLARMIARRGKAARLH
jgi:hypothetical protein